MSSRDRRTVAKGVAANIAVAGVLAVGAAVASAATAAADPPPPVPADPAVPAPPVAAPTDFLGTALSGFQPGGPDWVQGGSGAAPDFLLSQSAVPSLPGAQPASPLGDGSALNTGYLFPANATMTAQEQGNSMYGLGQAGDDDTAPPADKWEAIRRARGLFHTVMGKMPEDQLGEPLPGTAPPPGTNLPVGTNW
jgi:hypothetical protein